LIDLIKKNFSFISIYLVFALAVVLLIGTKGKINAQLFANQFHSSFFDFTFFWSTKIVEWFSFLVILGILLFKGAKFAINGLLIYAITAVTTFSLKRLLFFHELRPTSVLNELRLLPPEFGLSQLTSHSFPSGHTTAAFTLFCFITLISSNKKLGYIYGIIAAFIAYSRVYLSQHFFQDILAGATIGTIATFVFYFVLNKIKYGEWALKPLVKLKKWVSHRNMFYF